MRQVVSGGGWTPIRAAVALMRRLSAFDGWYTPVSSRAMAIRMAFSLRLCVSYHSRGSPAGSGRCGSGERISTGLVRGPVAALLVVGLDFFVTAAAAIGVLLAVVGARWFSSSRTASILPPPTDKPGGNSPWPQGIWLRSPDESPGSRRESTRGAGIHAGDG